MKKEKSCGAMIFRNINHQLEVLLIHQVQGHWCFPKGHVEKHETEEETALREIREETGITAKILPEFRIVTSYSPAEGILKDVIYFIASYQKGKGKVQEEEVAEMEWVTPETAMDRITFDNDRDLLVQAMQYLNTHEDIMQCL